MYVLDLEKKKKMGVGSNSAKNFHLQVYVHVLANAGPAPDAYHLYHPDHSSEHATSDLMLQVGNLYLIP